MLTAELYFSVKGITSKLDYLKELGVDIVWVSPSQYLSSLAQSVTLIIASIQKSPKGMHILE